jgi:hypothetical protein
MPGIIGVDTNTIYLEIEDAGVTISLNTTVSVISLSSCVPLALLIQITNNTIIERAKIDITSSLGISYNAKSSFLGLC